MKTLSVIFMAIALCGWAWAGGGETCADATVIPYLPYTDSGNTCGHTNNYAPTCSGSASSGPELVYSYTSPVDQGVTFHVCQAGYDNKLYIYDGSCAGSPIACKENSASCANTTHAYLGCVPLQAGHTYYIVIDGRSARDDEERCTCGTYTLVALICGEPPYNDYDMGDLAACNYPTLVANPAHGLSGIAWLGDNVSPEAAPNSLDLDLFDDGVQYLNQPWTPCQIEQVVVTVYAGPNYGAYADTGGVLYLNGWKDGNLDGDFDDEFDCTVAMASEWIVQDLLVSPGTIPLDILDPGVWDQGIYNGVFRWRLTHAPVLRYGYGQYDQAACPSMSPHGGTPTDYLGEVEDYIIEDLQLAVNLNHFEAIGGDGIITLRWRTASEVDNDRFEITRDDAPLTQVASQGNSPSGYSYDYTDDDVSVGQIYHYTLYAVDVNGARRELATASSAPTAPRGEVTEYALYQNYPNPFNPTTSIAFDLVENGTVKLTVYNLMGHEVARLVDGYAEAGHHEVTFDGAGLSSGMYWCKLEASDFTAVRKMTLLK